MEQNKNIFDAGATVDGPPAAPSSDKHPPPADSPSVLDFDPVDVSSRCDGWTPTRQREFIEALADCGVVREAAARVGMSVQSANRLRRRANAAAFNRAWELAVRIGADRLRSIAYERAVTGIVKQRYYKGEKIGEEIVYDNRLLVSLLGKLPDPLVHVNARQGLQEWDRWMEAIENGAHAPPSPREAPSPANEDDDPLFQIISSLLDQRTAAGSEAASGPAEAADSAE